MLTSEQMITLACQMAKCPNFTSQAGQFFNSILVNLALKNNLDIIRRDTTITTSGGVASYNLPTNFLRSRMVSYQINGIVEKLIEIDYEQYKILPQPNGYSDYPYNYAIDMSPAGGSTYSPPKIYFYPTPMEAWSMDVLYMDYTVEVPTPETSATVPWYTDQLYLIRETAKMLMMLTDDDRLAEFENLDNEELRKFLVMNNGDPNVVKRVTKDPRFFRNGRNLPPSKFIP